MPDALKEQVVSHLDRLAAKAHLSEGDRIAYDKAVDRYNAVSYTHLTPQPDDCQIRTG